MTTDVNEEPSSSIPTPDGDPWVGKPIGRLRNSRLGKILVLVAITCLVLGGAWWMNRPTVDASPVEVAGDGPPPVPGEPAVDFTATTMDGGSFTLSSHQGTPVWLSFVATWCSSCRTEAPDIQDAWQGSDGEVMMASVYLGESSATVTTWADRLGITYPQIPDPDGLLSGEYRVMAVPSHVFINRDGTVHSTHVGVLTREEMDAVLTELAEG